MGQKNKIIYARGFPIRGGATRTQYINTCHSLVKMRCNIHLHSTTRAGPKGGKEVLLLHPVLTTLLRKEGYQLHNNPVQVV